MKISAGKQLLQCALVTSLVVASGFGTLSGYAQTKPSMPVSLKIPATPIVWGSGGASDLGYLPGSSSVSSTGAYTYTIPIEVPPGRAGMAPALGLRYSSNAGNGVLGVGWALSGLSAISRCGQTFSTEGVSNGIHLTDFASTPEAQRDRFCIDGHKLVAINGSYGADQTEYRTEEDSHQRIISISKSPASVTQGPDSFTVSLPNGQILTYTAPTVTQWSATANGVKAANQVRIVWLLASQTDLSGNGIVYKYKTYSRGENSGIQILLNSIDYTTFNGPASKGDASGPYRHVTFSYESRPDQEFTWQAGVEGQLLQRLTTITLSAPNPAVSGPVWEYLITYQAQPSSFSGRSVLSTVQRCSMQGPSGKTPGAIGNCTWKKQFTYTVGSNTPTFIQTNVPSATNVDITPIVLSSPVGLPFIGPEPMVKVLDADGDGVDDLLFQAGQPEYWTLQEETYLENASCVPNEDNNFYCPHPPRMIAPLLILGTRTTATNVNPLVTPYDLSTDYGADLYLPNETTVSASYYGRGYYPWTALENLAPVDLDGNGKFSVFMAARVGPAGCTYRALDWGLYPDYLGLGMKDRGIAFPLAGNCTNWASSNKRVQFFFMDSDGDKRADIGTFNVQSGVSSDIQVSLNLGPNHFGAWSPPTQAPQGISAGCPFYVEDFSGDGRSGIFGQVGSDGEGCGGSATYAYSPFDGYSLTPDNNASMPDLPMGVPGAAKMLACPDGTSSCYSSPGYQPRPEFFGDFNGDGLADVISLDPVSKNLFLSWNTGNGFGPATQLVNTPWTTGSYKVIVADINRDGRADLIVFHDKPSRAITMMLSKGDGTFTSVDIPNADPGLNTPEGWTTSTIGDFNGDGLLDIAEVTGAAPTSDVLSIQNPPPKGRLFCDPNYVTSNPNEPCAVNNSQVLAIEKGTLQTLVQPTNTALFPGSMGLEPTADLLVAVRDEGATFNREVVSYASFDATAQSTSWSDKPEMGSCPLLSYPQHCLTKGLTVVRAVGSTDGVNPHWVYYSYERPAIDLRGRGFLGFAKVRVWDPTRLQQTITLYDNATEAGSLLPPPVNVDPYGPYVYFPPLFQPGYYPGSERPQSVTTVTLIPSSASPQNVPTVREGHGTANARVVQTVYNNQLVRTNNNKTYIIEPSTTAGTPAVVRSEWEQTAYYAAKVTDPADPTSDYVWSIYGSAPVSARVETTTVNKIDDFGNILLQSLQTSVGAQKGVLTQTVSTYKNSTSASQWLIGQLTSTTVTVTEPDPTELPVTRKMGFGYDTNGLQHTITKYQVEPSTTSTVSTTTFGRDNYGNVVSAATRAIGPSGLLETRQVNTEYDPLWPGQPNERIFPSQRWVPVSLNAGGGKTWTPSDWTLIHPGYGVVSAAMDANGVQASATYDDQGRPLKITPPVGAPTTIQYLARTDVKLGGNNGIVVIASSGGQTTQRFTDAAGRTIQKTHLGFDGKVVTDHYIQYDRLGRAITSWRPYTGTALPWTLPPGTTYPATMTYDGLDRAVKSLGPDGQPTTYAYSFFASSDQYPSGFSRTVSATTVTDPNGYKMRSDTDVDGRIIETANYLTSDAASPGWIRTMFHFAPFDLIDTVTMPSGAIETTTYDTLGQVTSHFSPDSGTAVNMAYDGFGELLSSLHKESGAVTSLNYDTIGRSSGWLNTDGAVVTSATLTYDTQPNGLGKLAITSSSDNIATFYSYDSCGRPTSMTETIDGKSYVIGRIYDLTGRLSKLQYPAIGSNSNPGMELQFNYNDYGYISYLSNVTAEPNGSTATGNLMTVTSRNADGTLAGAVATNVGWLGMGQYSFSYIPQTGQLKESTYASWGGKPPSEPKPSSLPPNLIDLIYSYYPNGLVKTRTDTVNGRLESYNYDSMMRLTDWSLGLCSATPCTPISASGLRHYNYDVDGDVTSVFRYAMRNNIPIKQTIETNTYGPLTGSGGGAQGGPHAINGTTRNGVQSTIAYDPHGRQIDNGSGRTITYNAFDLPRSVSQNGASWTLQYDAFGNRAVKTGTDGTAIYIGGIFEQRIPPAVNMSGVMDVFNVSGVGQVEANESTGITSTLYTMTDPLGSTNSVVQGQVVNGVMNEKTLNTFFYGPFGARINKDGGHYTSASFGDVHNGFTGQEHDDDFGLMNFRGRMYDPGLKRFLSADPIVAHPGFSQSWNPYSYVLNSPLNLTDPSGFQDSGIRVGDCCAPGTEDDTDSPLYENAPSQQQIDSEIPSGYTQLGAPYAHYDGGSFVAWQVGIERRDNTGATFSTYMVFPGFAPPTQAPQAPGPQAATEPPLVNGGNHGTPLYTPLYMAFSRQTFWSTPVDPRVLNSVASEFMEGVNRNAVPLVATMAMGAVELGVLGGLEFGPGAAVFGKTFVSAVGDYTGATSLFNGARAASSFLFAGGSGVGLGTRLWLALNMGAAEAMGWGVLGGGAAYGVGSRGTMMWNSGAKANGVSAKWMPQVAENTNGAFSFSSPTTGRGVNFLVQKIANAIPDAQIYVLSGGHGALSGAAFVNNPSLKDVGLYIYDLNLMNASLPNNASVVNVFNGNDPAEMAEFLALEGQAALGGTSIFTVRAYCFSSCTPGTP